MPILRVLPCLVGTIVGLAPPATLPQTVNLALRARAVVPQASGAGVAAPATSAGALGGQHAPRLGIQAPRVPFLGNKADAQFTRSNMDTTAPTMAGAARASRSPTQPGQEQSFSKPKPMDWTLLSGFALAVVVSAAVFGRRRWQSSSPKAISATELVDLDHQPKLGVAAFIGWPIRKLRDGGAAAPRVQCQAKVVEYVGNRARFVVDDKDIVGDALEAAHNAMERATGLDLDGDGDIGEKGRPAQKKGLGGIVSGIFGKGDKAKDTTETKETAKPKETPKAKKAAKPKETTKPKKTTKPKETTKTKQTAKAAAPVPAKETKATAEKATGTAKKAGAASGAGMSLRDMLLGNK